MKPLIRKQGALTLLGLAWGISVFTGISALARYESIPGAKSEVTAMWPSASRIRHRGGTFTFILFAHPKCPCTKASIAELEKLQAKLPGRFDSRIVLGGVNEGAGAVDVSMFSVVERDPGTSISVDPHGTETKLFAAQTSGESMLFNPKGKLVFHGGITSSRGHEGDNVGSEMIARLISGEHMAAARTSVFGCSLRDPTASMLKEDTGWKR